MKDSIIIVKLGGSIITDKSKPYTPNKEAIMRLAREIKKAKMPVIVVHGQGSFAHTSAKKYGGKKGYKSLFGIATVFKDAMAINSIVIDALIDAKIPAVSFRPNSLFLARNGKLSKNNLETVFEALKQGLVPVLYGDVIMDTVWKTTIFSGEVSARHLALFLSMKKIVVTKIIQVGITDGVYDNRGKTINEITVSSFKEIKKHLYGSKSTDVTGGMTHKVEEAIALAKFGIPTIILNGMRKNSLYQALVGAEQKYHTIIK